MQIEISHLDSKTNAQSFKSQEWTITSDRSPNIFSICSRCNQRQSFMSSEKFRVNANKRKIDVWLIYKCTKCDNTLNVEVLARKPVTSIDPIALHEYTNNSPNMASKVANDIRLFGTLGYELEDVPYTLNVRELEEIHDDTLIKITPLQPIYLRMDKVIADGLNISRSRVDKLLSDSKIQADIDLSLLRKRKLFDSTINLQIKR